VRSSATAEDLPTASFAGQQETFLNVRGYQELKEACIKCYASLFTDRAISYRIDNGFDHFKVALSIGIMKMVRSDLASSGVIFTLDTETGFRDVIFITGAYGLGENVVQGAVIPDEFYVFKPTLRQGFRPIIRKGLGDKKIKMIYGTGESKALTHNVDVPDEDRRRFCISDDDVLTLARYAMINRGSLLEEGREGHANGHRVGQGWQDRRALHSLGQAGDRPVSEDRGNSGNISPGRERSSSDYWKKCWGEDRQWQGAHYFRCGTSLRL
jgi:hypothetical protein